MKKHLFIFLVLFYSKNAFTQDTLYLSTPHDGNFSVNEFDSVKRIWSQKEYVNHVLFSIEHLAEDKYHSVEDYTGYFPDGSIAFKRNYYYDGKYSEPHGEKLIYYKNGKLKEKGQYFHGVKYGNWEYYNQDGKIKQMTQYNVPLIDTLTKMSSIPNFQKYVSKDTITSEADLTFYATIPIVSLGKNGFEIIYLNNSPIELRKFEYGVLVSVEKRKRIINKVLKSKI